MVESQMDGSFPHQLFDDPSMLRRPAFSVGDFEPSWAQARHPARRQLFRAISVRRKNNLGVYNFSFRTWPFYTFFGNPWFFRVLSCSPQAALPSEADVDVIGISYFGNDYIDEPMDESQQLWDFAPGFLVDEMLQCWARFPTVSVCQMLPNTHEKRFWGSILAGWRYHKGYDISGISVCVS